MSKYCYAWFSAMEDGPRLDKDSCGYGLKVAQALSLEPGPDILVCIITRKNHPQQTRVLAPKRKWELAKGKHHDTAAS